MVRRTTHAYDTTIAEACPKCRVSLKLLRTSIPQIDSCGFESCFFQCESCKSSLAGVIDPMNEELFVSLIGPAIDVAARPKELDYQTKPLIGYAEKSVPIIWYRSDGVEPPADFFARPEGRNVLLRHLDLNATSWISANATCSTLYRKCAKASQLNAILSGHRGGNFIEYNVYGFFHHAVGEMKELTCYVDRQLRFDHYKVASVVVE